MKEWQEENGNNLPIAILAISNVIGAAATLILATLKVNGFRDGCGTWQKALPGGRAFVCTPQSAGGSREGVPGSVPQAPLPAPLPPDRRLALPLSLGTGLLVEATLPKLGVETGPLDLSLETAKGPIEALVVLDDNFQTDHAPFRGIDAGRAIKNRRTTQ